MKSALVMTLLFAGLACGDGKKVDIVGRWSEVKGTDQVEFAADGVFRGTLTLGRQPITMPVGGTYSVNGDTVSIDLRSNGLTIWRIKPRGDGRIFVTIINSGLLSRDDNSTAVFQRIK